MGPVGDHAETFELSLLDDAEFIGEFGASFAHFERRVIGAPGLLQLA